MGSLTRTSALPMSLDERVDCAVGLVLAADDLGQGRVAAVGVDDGGADPDARERVVLAVVREAALDGLDGMQELGLGVWRNTVAKWTAGIATSRQAVAAGPRRRPEQRAWAAAYERRASPSRPSRPHRRAAIRRRRPPLPRATPRACTHDHDAQLGGVETHDARQHLTCLARRREAKHGRRQRTHNVPDGVALARAARHDAECALVRHLDRLKLQWILLYGCALCAGNPPPWKKGRQKPPPLPPPCANVLRTAARCDAPGDCALQ